jgi:5-methylcytosine-specific restriction endonuclease McrA
VTGAERARAYRQAHPEWWKAAVAAFNANALARRYGFPERITTKDVQALWAREPHCADCGIGRGLDHITPVRLGGLNHPSNLRTLCRFCNARRGGINSGRERRARRAA